MTAAVDTVRRRKISAEPRYRYLGPSGSEIVRDVLSDGSLPYGIETQKRVSTPDTADEAAVLSNVHDVRLWTSYQWRA